jgi:AraC-like DNA-binding protein
MKKKSSFILLFLTTIFLFNNNLFSQEDVRPPFELKSFSISMLDSNERTATIEISSDFLSDGNVEAELYLPDEFKIKSGDKKINSGKMNRGENLSRQWTVQIPKEGYFLIEVNINIREQKLIVEGQGYANYHSFPMYVEIKDGNIVGYNYKQDSKYTSPTIEDNKEPKDKKPVAYPVPFDSSGLGIEQQTIVQKQTGIASYIIRLQVIIRESFNMGYKQLIRLIWVSFIITFNHFPSTNLEEIAEYYGYDNANSLSRDFKKIFNKSASQVLLLSNLKVRSTRF